MGQRDQKLSLIKKFHLTNPINLFIHSGYFYSASLSPPTTQRRARYSTDTVSEFHADELQATASEGLAQRPYMAARAGFEPTTLRMKCDESTNEPPRPRYRDIKCPLIYNVVLIEYRDLTI